MDAFDVNPACWLTTDGHICISAAAAAAAV
jgi:hypothetical protein